METKTKTEIFVDKWYNKISGYNGVYKANDPHLRSMRASYLFSVVFILPTLSVITLYVILVVGGK